MLLLPTLLLSGCGEKPESAASQIDLTPAEAQALAKEAYLYGFPNWPIAARTALDGRTVANSAGRKSNGWPNRPKPERST